jgi:hypothetical protein
VGPQLSQMCELTEKIFYVFHGPWTLWPVTIYYIYIRGDQMCDGSPTIASVWDDDKKKFYVFHGPWTWWPVTIFYIYKRRPNVWWVTNYHRCVSWQKKFFMFSMDHEHCGDQWPSFIYIRGDLMCDGSPTIASVWDARKNFLCFPWTMNMVTSDHLLYIYDET